MSNRATSSAVVNSYWPHCSGNLHTGGSSIYNFVQCSGLYLLSGPTKTCLNTCNSVYSYVPLLTHIYACNRCALQNLLLTTHSA